MKKLILVTVFILGGFSIQAQEKLNKNAKYEIEVNGNCEMCQSRIQKAAFSVPGVKSANWSAETHKMNLILNEEKANILDVKKAVAKAGGLSGWRLPTPIESYSILNHQNSNPAINTTYFTLTTAEYWWTSVFENNSTTKVWCTNSGGGIGNHPKIETISAGGTKKFHARAVRNINTPTTITNHFTDNGDGTITDNLTQLVWQKIPNANIFTWEQALSYAEGLTIGTNSDWRLPNIKELQSINNEFATNPSVFAPYFSSVGVHNYWSSTTLPNQALSAWYWSTTFGITTYSVKTGANYVICVRGNPSLSLNTIEPHTSIKIHPNPTSDLVSISFPSYTTSAKIEIVDAMGKIVLSKEIVVNSNEYLLDTEGISGGIYYLSIINGNNTNTYKIIMKK